MTGMVHVTQKWSLKKKACCDHVLRSLLRKNNLDSTILHVLIIMQMNTCGHCRASHIDWFNQLKTTIVHRCPKHLISTCANS